MFWDKIAFIYDLFENVYNYNVYKATGKEVAKYIHKEDHVLECACGTGAISVSIASASASLIATDFSLKMIKEAKKKCKKMNNIVFEQADIMNLRFEDNFFDVVVAGNVIHLLSQPKQAMKELERVCKVNGTLIIPTYINESETSSRLAVKFLEKLGAKFNRQFDLHSYQTFFMQMGYTNVEYQVVEGRMPCCIAIIKKNTKQLV